MRRGRSSGHAFQTIGASRDTPPLIMSATPLRVPTGSQNGSFLHCSLVSVLCDSSYITTSTCKVQEGAKERLAEWFKGVDMRVDPNPKLAAHENSVS